ncbi:hypothetical protein ABZT02_31485 [Streptomyces sp. NPDC005402]
MPSPTVLWSPLVGVVAQLSVGGTPGSTTSRASLALRLTVPPLVL